LAPSAYVDILMLDVTDADWYSYFGGGYGGGFDGVYVVLQLLLPAAMVEVLMLILKVVPMVVMRVAPLMMSDGFIVLLLPFSPFWCFDAKGGEISRVLF
jgi:hypothetical protein